MPKFNFPYIYQTCIQINAEYAQQKFLDDETCQIQYIVLQMT